MYKLTKQGIQKCEQFIAECNAKRKEILDAGLDTADDTGVLTTEIIEQDLEGFVDEVGDYYNYWGVTDNYNSDWGIGLTLGIDFIEVAEQTLHDVDIRKEAYELYKIDWEHDHGISGERKLEAYRNYITIEKEAPGCYGSFESYLDDVGYGGELYACYDEFIDTEYLDEEYMRSLLEIPTLINAYQSDRFNMENGIIDIRAEAYKRYKEDVNGFGVYSSYEEFIKDEYLETHWMYALMLSEPDLLEAYRFDLQKMAMELADWHLLEKNGNQTLWYLDASDDEPWLPFKIDKTSLSQRDKQNGFTLRFNSCDEIQEYLENIIITDPHKEVMYNKMVYPRIGFETLKRKGR